MFLTSDVWKANIYPGKKNTKLTDLLLHVPLARLISPFKKYVYRSWRHFLVTTASLSATAASSSPRVIGWLPCPSTSSGKSAIPSWRASGGASATIIRYWTHFCALLTSGWIATRGEPPPGCPSIRLKETNDALSLSLNVCNYSYLNVVQRGLFSLPWNSRATLFQEQHNGSNSACVL